MPEALRVVGIWLLTYLVHSSVLIAGAWLISRSGRVRRARTLDLLWKAALMAGFLTSTVAMTRAPARASQHAEALRLGKLLVRPAPGAPLQDWTETAPGVHPVRVTMKGRGAAGSWPTGLVLLWLAGGVVAVTLGAVRRRRMRGILDPVEAAAPATLALARAIASRAGTAVDVVVSDVVGSPCVVGRRIVLPPRCEKELSAGELNAVLAHEVAHVARRDGLWAALADLLCRAAWIQPLNVVAAAASRDAAEAVCDGWAVRHARPLDLARSICRVAEWATPGRRLVHASALARGDSRALSARVRRILTSSGRDGLALPWRGMVLVAALVACTVMVPPVRLAREVTAVFIGKPAEPGAAPGGGDGARTFDIIIRGPVRGDGSRAPAGPGTISSGRTGRT